jgi:ADP-ribosylation factor GTPase-activating protein 2/3
LGDGQQQQPNVDFLNSMPAEAPKSTIGVRKIQPKKTGMGGVKKGLGATKVKTNFADLEQRVSMADQKREAPEKKMTEDEQVEAITSMRLAYEDLSVKQQREEDRLKAVDPNKAKQMERLGMGFNNRGSTISHSAVSDMQTMHQDVSPKFSTKSYERDTSSDFFDDYTTSMYNSSSARQTPSKELQRDAMMMGFETIEPIDSQQNIQTMFSTSNDDNKKSSSRISGKCFTTNTPLSDVLSKCCFSEQPTYSRNTRGNANTKNNNYDVDDKAQKKFAGAKAISSDQFFDNEPSGIERSANLNRFQGSNSISSSDYFGDGTSQRGGGGGGGSELET